MGEEGRLKLWEKYSVSKDAAIREQLIIEYAALVKIVAGRLNMYLGYAVEQDDLAGYGTFGLIDAIDKFDYAKGIKFETYASLRIRGSILDHIRKMDWIPRTLRQKQKKINQAIQKLEITTGHNVTEQDIAKELDISVEEYEKWQNQMKITSIISLDEFLEQGSDLRQSDSSSSHFAQPEHVMEREEMKEVLMKVLEKLTENERKVITLYYYEELTLKEISHILEVSESRISQLHTKALQKMKKELGNIDFL